jgi:hypothetical protein
MGIYCFYHICCVAKGFEVFKEQLQLLKSSGLLNKLDKLYLGLLGDYHTFLKMDLYLNEPKIHVIYTSKDVTEMEFPTISSIKNFCDNSVENHKILYIHTKNIRYPNSLTHLQWRKYLEYFNIERHDECIKDLDTYDTCGVNFHIKPWKHYSGNFWWATSNHIKKLVHPNILPRDGTRTGAGGRYNMEKWLLTHLKITDQNRLIILSGNYGISLNESIDVTNILKNECSKDNRLYIKDTVNINELFGDPYPYKVKNLFVTYQINNQTFSEEIQERATKLKRDLLIDVCQIKIRNYHESNINHYHDNYPPEKYIK